MSNKRILDEIEDHNDDSSVESVDSEALRLDTKPAQKQLFYTEEEDLEVKEEENIIRPKKVRFKRRQRDRDEDASTTVSDPWDFAEVVQSEFRDKLPSNYEIKRWKRPTKHMVRSVVQLVETDFEAAIEEIFEKYKGELRSVVVDTAPLHRQKHLIMSDMLSKIKHQLKKTKFPSRISDRDMDVEYIVSKRKYIQARYAQELTNAEKLEDELIRQQKRLQESREVFDTLQMSNKRKLKDQLMRNGLHPSIVKAMENAYGLIPDGETQNGPRAYEKDVMDLKLDAGESCPMHNIEPEIERLLPALRDYKNVSRRLHDNVDTFMTRIRYHSIASTLQNSQGQIPKENS
ncbi:OKP1 (YGR179C) [Zygosaccharomyces parabailii]|nr:OKP1 (YGR179C) [Zygosaccharomyces parabailii]